MYRYLIKKTKYKHKISLSFKGFIIDGDNLYKDNLSEREEKSLYRYCRLRNLSIDKLNMDQKRSSDYRKKFFDNNKPTCNHNTKYRCVYCGRKLSPAKVTVDHLYPVDKAMRSDKICKKMRRQGINNVNDVNNLVPACERCNKSKSNHMGKWIIKGKLGQLRWYWPVMNVIRLTLLICLIIIIYGLSK